MVPDIGELEMLEASEILARRLIAKKVLMPKIGGFFTFLVEDETVKLSGSDQVCRRTTSIQDYLARDQEHDDVLL